jgi:hypothetical protein
MRAAELLTEQPRRFPTQRWEMRVADRHNAIGPFEERFSERDHVASVRIPKILRCGIAEPHTIHSVGVFQERR